MPFPDEQFFSLGAFKHSFLTPSSLRVFIPTALTFVGLFFGLLSLWYASLGFFTAAAACVFWAMLFDFSDGYVARFLGVSSVMGAHLDTLADFVSYGVAPAFLMYTLVLHKSPFWGTLACLIFVFCSATRLARFSADVRRKSSGRFSGVPAPAGALLALWPLCTMFAFAPNTVPESGFLCTASWFSFVTSGILMISTFRTPSLKNVSFNALGPLLWAFLFCAIVFLLVCPWTFLVIAGGGYLVLLPYPVRHLVFSF